MVFSSLALLGQDMVPISSRYYSSPIGSWASELMHYGWLHADIRYRRSLVADSTSLLKKCFAFKICATQLTL